MFTKTKWENFNQNDIPKYLEIATIKTHAEINKINDFSKTYGEKDERRLYFMIEALIQARYLAQI